LLVVDSVSSPFREADASRSNGAFSRARVLGRVAALLREYAHRHDIAVVVTNHVVDAFGNSEDSEDKDNARRSDTDANAKSSKSSRGPLLKKQNVFGPAGVVSSSGRDVAPALGLFWANCVNTRLFLRRSGGSAGGFGGGEGVGGGGVVGGVTREACVVFSSHLPHCRDAEEGGAPIPFVVRKEGVFGLPSSGVSADE
jgi:DNA-repair protein XRCC3